MSECAKQFFQQALGIKVINADEWLKEEPPAPDQVLGNMLDAGDKMAVLASSKVRKSFFVQQMALSLAAGRRFMGWNVPKPRRVLYVQFEIREQHSHRRIWNLARAMDIGPKDLSGRLGIIAARGLGLAGVDGLKQIRQAASDFQSEVIIFDPLYKLAQGAENAAEDFKVILSAFDELAEATGAAIIYVHHDTKGSPGDKDIRDRGAGSNVLGRDYDACIALTPHKSEQNATVVETLLRNYPPQAPFAITWNCGNGGYCFIPADGVTPEKKTSRTKPPPPPSETYLPIAETILLPGNELQIGHFKTLFKEKTGLSDSRIKDFMNWATGGQYPPITTREVRGRGINEKWVRMSDDCREG